MADQTLIDRLNRYGDFDEYLMCGQCAFWVSANDSEGICSIKYHKAAKELSEIDAAAQSIFCYEDYACGLFEEEK